MISPTVTPTLRNTLFTTIPSAGGIPYTDFGRVLDYSTQVGPFTIVDKSGEGNTATLYSGRGLTMDGVSDLIDFGSPTFSEPVTSVTGYARSTDTSINLGLASATLAGNDTWETFSADTAAKDYGDAQWFNGVDTKVSVAAPLTAYPYTLEATIVTTGVNGVILWLGDTSVISHYSRIGVDANGKAIIISKDGGVNTSAASTTSVNDGSPHVIKGIFTSATNRELYVDGVLEATDTVAITPTGIDAFALGLTADSTPALYFDGLILNASLSDGSSSVLNYTGRGATPWKDTIGSNDGTVSGVDQTVTEYFTNPDFILGTGYNGDLSDIRCLGATGTVLGHWTLADWSNPAGNTSNGKTIVDSGPNGYHGVCTGCSGFTGEGIDPEVAGIVGLDDAQWFNGVDGYVRTFDNEIVTAPYQTLSDDITIQATITPSEVSASSSVAWTSAYTIIELRSTGSLALGDAVPFSVGINAGFLRFGCAINNSLNAETHDGAIPIIAGKSYIVKVVISGDTYALYVDDVLDVSGTLSNTGDRSVGTTLSTLSIGSRATDGNSAVNLFSGTISDLSLSDTSSLAAYTGRGTTPWKDTIGSNDGTPVGTFLTVGQKRATIPQTADRNWNKYDWNGGTPILSATGTMLVSESDANDQIDALGTAILEPRRNTQQLNLFGEGEYSRTPDSDSLDVTTEVTWELWGNFYGVPSIGENLFGKYKVANSKRSWVFQKSTSQLEDEIGFIVSNDGNFSTTAVIAGAQDKVQCLSVTLSGGVYVAYLDAQVVTLTGAIDTTVFASDEPVLIGTIGDIANFAARKIGSAKIYNVALTADEVLTNYNTQKSLYGL